MDGREVLAASDELGEAELFAFMRKHKHEIHVSELLRDMKRHAAYYGVAPLRFEETCMGVVGRCDACFGEEEALATFEIQVAC